MIYSTYSKNPISIHNMYKDEEKVTRRNKEKYLELFGKNCNS